MQKTIFIVGIAVLIFGLIVLALWMLPQETKTTYSGVADFGAASGWQVYEGTNYHMVYSVRFFAEMDDRIVITHTPLGNNGMFQRFFITGEQILCSYTSWEPFSAVVGTSTLPAVGSYGYWYHLNVGAPSGSDSGSWRLTVDVYSKKQNQVLLILSITLLTLGAIIVAFGARARKVTLLSTSKMI